MFLRKFVYPFKQGLFLCRLQRVSAEMLHCAVGSVHNFGNCAVAEELAGPSKVLYVDETVFSKKALQLTEWSGPFSNLTID